MLTRLVERYSNWLDRKFNLYTYMMFSDNKPDKVSGYILMIALMLFGVLVPLVLLALTVSGIIAVAFIETPILVAVFIVSIILYAINRSNKYEKEQKGRT